MMFRKTRAGVRRVIVAVAAALSAWSLPALANDWQDKSAPGYGFGFEWRFDAGRPLAPQFGFDAGGDLRVTGPAGFAANAAEDGNIPLVLIAAVAAGVLVYRYE